MLANLKRIVGSFLLKDVEDEEEDFNPSLLINQQPWRLPTNVSPEHQVRKRGVITFIGNSYGVIDKLTPFSPELLEGQTLTIGTEVDYTFLPNSGGSGDVLSITPTVPEDTWEDADDNVNSIETAITQRNGRELIFSCGITCNLDNVSSSFLPVVGDIVNLAIEETDGVKEVKAITPARRRGRTGVVTQFMSCNGEIDHDVKFSLDVCGGGFLPFVGDEVIADIIASKQGTCNWRALSVTSFGRIQPILEMPTEEISGSDDAITITGSTNFGKMKLEDFSHELALEIRNVGATVQILHGGKFKRKFSQVEVCNLNPTKIDPGGSVKIWFRARPNFVGQHAEKFTFEFKDFSIFRTFQLIVSEFVEISDCIQAQPFVRSSVPSFIDLESEHKQRTYGPKPFNASRFKKLQNYQFPKKLWTILTSGGQNYGKVDTDIKEQLIETNPCLIQELTFANYSARLNLMVYFEEAAVKMSLMNLTMTQVFFLKRGDYLVLEIPNLAEKRPSVIRGDKVKVKQPWNSKNDSVHVGYIYEVSLNSISTIFHPSFHDSYDCTMCDVEFETSVSQFNHMLRAIAKANTDLGRVILFPEILPQHSATHATTNITADDIVWCNKALNKQQKMAVVNILRGECRPLPYFIFGPPGTGKTVTVVEAVLQICRTSPTSRVLVCGPSNSSADLLAQRIIQGGCYKPHQCARLIAFSRLEDSIPDGLEDYCIQAHNNENEGGVLLGHHKITVATCTTAANLHLLNLPRFHFTHIIIDEAGYANEPDALIPLSFLDPKNGQAVLAGDPQQLGPVSLSPYSVHFDLDESLLSRLMKRFPYARDSQSYQDTLGYDPRLVTQLIVNYRSVPEILKLPSDLFYHSVLQPTVSPDRGREAEVIRAFAEHVPIEREKPVTILFHGVRGENIREADSPSWMNPHELCEALRYIRILYDLGVTSDELGVVSPYRKQITKLRQLATTFQLPIPKMGSVEEFQGQERMVVVMSCVRSTTALVSDDTRLHLGFVKCPNRVNVALTRARALLIIIGNPHLLCTDPCWRAVLTYCVERNAYIGCDLPEILESKYLNSQPKDGCDLLKEE